MSQIEETFAFHIRAAGLPDPVREYKFHPMRKWRFDMAWPVQMLAIEVEGGTWSGGRHTTGSGFKSDCIKYNEATILGWRVLRVTGDMINDGTALKYAESAINAKLQTNFTENL